MIRQAGILLVPREAEAAAVLASGTLTEVEELIATCLTASPDSPHAPFSDAINAAVHHIKSGGRRVRAQLALEAGMALGIEAENAVILATTVELLHNASLIHDDLQDRSRTRRGQTSVWLEYGDGIAVCAGDLLISAAYFTLASYSVRSIVPALFKLTHERVVQSISGQCADLAAQLGHPLDVQAYERVSAKKSGALLSLPLELPLLAAGREHAMPLAREAANAFAIGFQIMDDLADIKTDMGDDGRPEALNLVLLLETAGLGLRAKDEARSVAMKHLKASATMADDLPNGAGMLLRTLALRLCEDI